METPNRKVKVAGLSAALQVVLVFAVHTFTPVRIDAETALALGGLINFIVSFYVPNLPPELK